MNKVFWLFWLLLTLVIAGFYGYKIFKAENKEELLIGEATHGHYQIELSCGSCHTDAFGGEVVLQEACEGCHAAELKEALDSHPLSKFRDPRNADLLEGLDARYCVSCHTEHQNEQTHPMGLTLPTDYCMHCHQEIADERPSHENLGYETCASAGCHNYHDNRALYETFLVENSGGEWLQAHAIPKPNWASQDAIKYLNDHASGYADQPDTFTEQVAGHPEITEHWQASAHAEAGVTCGGCHSGDNDEWVENPGMNQCVDCHSREAEGFLAGKHGMRLAEGLTAISPAEGRLSFTEESQQIHQSCTGCHSAHSVDTQYAATEGCLGCHNDQHSLAFPDSPHAQIGLGNPLTSGLTEGSEPTGSPITVSCATCHMPRINLGSDENPRIYVEHNQNMNLRPNEKMIRPVCMQCHSLDFSIDALADPELILNNFSGQPSRHIPSIDWTLQRAEEH